MFGVNSCGEKGFYLKVSHDNMLLRLPELKEIDIKGHIFEGICKNPKLLHVIIFKNICANELSIEEYYRAYQRILSLLKINPTIFRQVGTIRPHEDENNEMKKKFKGI